MIRILNKITNGALFSENGKQHLNGDARAKKHSVTDSVHSKTRFSDTGDESK